VVRIETRSEAGVLITVIMTPDVNTISPGRTRTVTGVDQALSLVAGFLRGYEKGELCGNAHLDVNPDPGHGDD
jgi:hypothetical protein